MKLAVDAEREQAERRAADTASASEEREREARELRARLEEASSAHRALKAELDQARRDAAEASGGAAERIRGLEAEIESERERAEAAAARLDRVREGWLPKPPNIDFGREVVLLRGTGLQPVLVRELLYKQDGTCWAGDGTHEFAKVGAIAQWDGTQA